MDKDAITINTIAAKAGVSPMTVSRAINNKKHVKKETRDKVFNVIEELGYEPNQFARGLRTSKSFTIGLVVADIENPFHAKLAKAVINVCERYNYSVIVCNSNYDSLLAEKYIKMLIQKGIDGIILSTFLPTDRSLDLITKRNIPVLLSLIKTENEEYSYIVSDDYLGGKLAAEYLIGLGHQKILFLRTFDVFSANERVRAFLDSAGRHHLPVHNCVVSQILNNEDDSYNEMKRRLEEGFDFTGILAANDFLAMGAMEALYEKGYKIPDDISLVGYDDLEFTSILRVPLTTVRQPPAEFGRLSAEMLLEVVRGVREDAEPLKITRNPELIIRKSCAELKD